VLLEWHETIRPELLRILLNAKNPMARAYAVRLVGRWHDRMENAEDILAKAVIDSHPRVRLEAVVAASYLKSPATMPMMTRVLDQKMDRFIKTSLDQATYTLQPWWQPALLDGAIDFEKPEHLAYVLQFGSNKETSTTIHSMLKKPALASNHKNQLMSILALKGNAKDYTWLLENANKNPIVLKSLVEGATVQNTRPSEAPDKRLAAMIRSGRPEIQIQALKLLGVWKARSQSGLVRNKVMDETVSIDVRGAAIETLGLLEGEAAIELLSSIAGDSDIQLRRQAIGALSKINLRQAAVLASVELNQNKTVEDVKATMLPFLSRTGGLDALAEALSEKKVPSGLAIHMRSVLGAAGRQSSALDQVLAFSAGGQLTGMPIYSESYVRDLALEVAERGDGLNGAKVYQSTALSCVACHKVGDVGGELGPQLTAVGAGVPVELIIEAVLWPKRQIKEGFVATTLTTKSGQYLSGYIESEDKRTITIREVSSGEVRTIRVDQLKDRQGAGTLMPPGLTAGLSRTDLRDLIRYLSELKG
jgi:putative heme-binding domain-containing protein